jgi:dTDP-4-dehydrorhamnose reductase
MGRKILVAGASGMLGHTFCALLAERGVKHVRHGHSNSRGVDAVADLSDSGQARSLLDELAADVVINLAGATNVERCEAEPDWAKRINVDAVANLAQWVSENPARRLVHMSTDMVYSGIGPHDEENARPINRYGATKLEGEKAALRVGGLVLRANFFGRSLIPERLTFNDAIVAALRSGSSYGAFADVLFNPLTMDTLTRAILEVAGGNLTGVFNVGATTSMSKAEFARAVARQLKLDESLVRCDQLSNRAGLAQRPRDMRMKVGRFIAEAMFPLPTLEEEIGSLERAYA